MKILYISFFFPPFNTIGGLRAYGQVKALREAGCDVRVITSANQGFEKEENFDYENLGRDTYYIRSSNQVMLPSSRASSLKVFLINLPRIFNRYFFLLKYLILGEEKKWLQQAKLEYASILGTWVPDIIMSSQSPISSHELASYISTKTDTKWAAEYRDSWSYNPMAFSASQYDLSSIIMRLIEKKILKNCSLIVSATKNIKSYYEEHFKIDNFLLYGGWETEINTYLAPPIRRKIQITHLGSMLQGRRSIKPILNIVNRSKTISKKYEFQFIGRDTDIFKKSLRDKAKDSVFLKGLVPFNEAEQYGYKTDILLILMMDHLQEKYTLTGKIFDYIKYKKPILIVDPFESEASVLIKEYDLGHVFKTYDDLEIFLESVSDINDLKCVSEENRLLFKRTNQIAGLLKYLEQNLI